MTPVIIKGAFLLVLFFGTYYCLYRGARKSPGWKDTARWFGILYGFTIALLAYMAWTTLGSGSISIDKIDGMLSGIRASFFALFSVMGIMASFASPRSLRSDP